MLELKNRDAYCLLWTILDGVISMLMVFKILCLMLCLIQSGHSKSILFRKDDKTTTVVGDIFQVALPLGAIGITAAKKDYYGLIHLFRSQLLTVGATYALKYSVNERRPNGGKYSFPSGHSSIAFCSATYLFKRYGYHYGLPAFALASFVGYSRVKAKVHYWHDVIGGAALAMGITYFFTDKYPYDVGVVHNNGFTGISVGMKL